MSGENLPTKLEVYNHYLYLNKEQLVSGEWKQNTKFYEKVRLLRDQVADVWDKTSIPHGLEGREGLKKVSNLLLKCRDLNKVAMDRRKEGFGDDLHTLFDVAKCNHEEESCSCDEEIKVNIYKTSINNLALDNLTKILEDKSPRMS